MKSLSHVRLFATPRTVARQASLSIGFSRQEYWTRLPFPSPGDLPNPGIQPRSPALQVDSLPAEPQGSPNESENCSVLSDSLRPHGRYSPGVLQARILECVAGPFSRGSSQPRDQTQVSHIASRFFTSGATRAAQEYRVANSG